MRRPRRRSRRGAAAMTAQLELPLSFVPEAVRGHGLRTAHVAPLVGRRIGQGKQFWSGRVPASHAWAYPYIAMADAGTTWATITLDCDHRQAMGAGLSALPPVNWMIRTQRGGHLTWCLADPVAKHKAARAAPEQYLAAVSEYYAAAVCADPAFGGMGRNPTHRDAETIWGREEPYSLDQLANVVPFGWQRPLVATTAVGRNVDLFQTGLRWAGKRANASLPVLPALHAVNAEVAALHGKPPLPDAEVGDVARSIERYRERWARQGHKPSWLARQAARGRKGGRPRLYEPGREPWTLAGVSRATWYRRRKREILANTVNHPLGGPCSPPLSLERRL